ncbi:hypothetical protein Dimus_000337, partial [Dionaea muscipula]
MSRAAVMMGGRCLSRWPKQRATVLCLSVMIGERVTVCGDGGVVLDGFGDAAVRLLPRFLGVTEQRRQC